MRFFRAIVETGKLVAQVAAVPLAVAVDVVSLGAASSIDGESLTRKQMRNVEDQADNVDEAVKS